MEGVCWRYDDLAYVERRPSSSGGQCAELVQSGELIIIASYLPSNVSLEFNSIDSLEFPNFL